MNERRAQLDPAHRLEAARGASERLLALAELEDVVHRAGWVAGFLAVRSEIDPAPALDEARRRGARVAFPRVADDREPRLCFHGVDPSELRAGRFGIPEPPADSAEVLLEDIDLMIVPGLAFDAEGRRLGFGGGYYDEVLSRRRGLLGRAAGTGDSAALGPKGPRLVVGLAYDFQIVDACPAEPHDQPIDCVVTESRVIRRRLLDGAS
jgi:5-formyltetrahydrofolate cyclo-ligase